MEKKPEFQAKKRPNEDLFDLHLIGANGEHMAFGNQGYERRNVKRAVASIKKAVASAELVFVVEK
jgi:uncharacterized protein YegP (UPF0339 family)